MTSRNSWLGVMRFQSLAQRSAPNTAIPRSARRSSRPGVDAKPGKRKNGVCGCCRGGAVKRGIDGRDAAVDFRHGRGGTHMAEQRVAEAMVCNRMAFGQLSAREFGMGRRIPAEQKERRPHAFALEGIEYGRGGAWPRPVIEGEHHFLVCEGQGGREVLAADPRSGGWIDREHSRGAQCLRVTGAGRPRFGRRRDLNRRKADKNSAD